MNWTIDLKRYSDKLKKYIINAVETGELIRTKGKGANGKFTVPGLKIKRKKKPKRLPKSLDVVRTHIHAPITCHKLSSSPRTRSSTSPQKRSVPRPRRNHRQNWNDRGKRDEFSRNESWKRRLTGLQSQDPSQK